MQIFYRRVFAFEINRYYTRGMIVKLSGKKARVVKQFSVAHYGNQFLDDKHIAMISQATHYLKSDIEDCIVVNFPFRDIIFSVQQMPKMSEDQLRNAVKFKLSEDYHIQPSKLIVDVSAESSFSPMKIGMTEEDTGNSLPVFAAKKVVLDRLLSTLMGTASMPEPDIVIPDNLKYLELMNQQAFKEDTKSNRKLNFMICQDIDYTVLFTFFGSYLIDVKEIPVSLINIVKQGQTEEVTPQNILDVLMEGSEIGSLSYTQSLNEVFDDHYSRLAFESEKAIRSTLNNTSIVNPMTKINKVYVCSINNRLTLDLEYRMREENILRGIEVERLPFKDDFPDQFEKMSTTLGIAYRGVRKLGKYQFIQTQEAKI